MADDLNDMLSSPTKKVDEASNVLARLWRQILCHSNIGVDKWNAAMQRYLDDPRNGIPRAGKQRSSERGNLNKALCKPSITWGVFIKGIRFLAPKRVEFTVKITWFEGKTTQHSIKTDTLDDFDVEDFIEEGDNDVKPPPSRRNFITKAPAEHRIETLGDAARELEKFNDELNTAESKTFQEQDDEDE